MGGFTFLWPDGKRLALTTSWDDGAIHDRRLVELFNRHGVKGTFNLNSSTLGQEGRLAPAELKTLFAGHEVAGHGVTHPFLERLPASAMVNELIVDRIELEKLTGYPVTGFALPFGTYDSRVVNALAGCGYVYSRTVKATDNCLLPDNFLEWHPTCHHAKCLERLKDFVVPDQPWARRAKLFYLWGHSFEFDRNDNWNLIEEFCQQVAHIDGVWHATNMEVHRYVTAMRSLVFSVDGRMVHNPSRLAVWHETEAGPAAIPPGDSRSA